MADEDELFAQAMGKVEPIAESNKVKSEQLKRPKRVLPSRSVRVGQLQPARQDIIPAKAEQPWHLVADGISRERLKRLAAGQPAVELTFDLHGVTRDEAMELLASAFAAAQLNGQRVVRIIHGKGLHSQGRAILKETVYHWLQHGPYAHLVLAAIPDPKSGGGACLVLLRR